MGQIREELVLADGFSSTFSSFASQGDEAVSVLKSIERELESVRDIAQNSQDFMTGFAEGFSTEFARATQHIQRAGEEQSKVTRETENTANAAGNWVNKIKGAIAALGAAKMAKNFIETADELTLINSRLDAINDGIYKGGQLQEQVFAAAQRSRGSYQDTAGLVARIGQNAGNMFNNAEAIQFAENMNKSFKIAGASQQEMASATLQLSQALAAGTLRGEEFNAINEAAPTVIQRIADYMGKEKGEMRELAQQGAISAEVVKAAMLSATDEINQQFESIPMTWADMMTQGQNMITMGLSDIMEQWQEFINSVEGQELFNNVIAGVLTFAQIASEAFMAAANAVLWLQQNWESLLPIIDVVIAAVIVYEAVQIAAALSAAAAWAAANIPVIIFIGLIAVTIAWMQSLGVKFQQVGQVIGTVLGTIYAVGYNVFANLWNLIATFAEFFANVFNDPVGSVVRLFTGAFDAILGVVEAVAGAIDTLLNTNMSGAVAGFRGRMSSWVADTYKADAVKIQRMANLDVKATATEWGNVGSDLGGKLDNVNLSLKGLSTDVGNIDSSNFNIADAVGGGGNGGKGQVGKVGSVGKIENDVKLSDEDLKIYRDLAEARYLTKIELKTLAPNIKVSVPKSQNLSPKDVADAIKAVIIEQSASHTATAHA